MKLCEYGCGQEAKYQFKNGKWCCSNSHKSCLGFIKLRPKTRQKNKPEIIKNNHYICEYGCNEIAKYKLKNGKYCCSTHWKKCSYQKTLQSIKYKTLNILNELLKIKLYKKYIAENKLCDYGCGNKGKYLFKNGKFCCQPFHSQCSNIRQNNKEKCLGNNNHFYGQTHTTNTIQLMKINSKLTIPKIKNKYPFFSQIEEMRYNPDKLEEKEIQVYCKNHDCKNSKEQGGWFTPKSRQLYERIRQLESPEGNDGSYFYCCEECKDECILYGLHSDPYKEKTETPYTQEEYNIWKQVVLEQDTYECQYCGSKEDLHCHHIHPVKTHPHLSLDPMNGIVLCKECHYEIGHKIGTECSTGYLANINQNGCNLGIHI